MKYNRQQQHGNFQTVVVRKRTKFQETSSTQKTTEPKDSERYRIIEGSGCSGAHHCHRGQGPSRPPTAPRLRTKGEASQGQNHGLPPAGRCPTPGQSRAAATSKAGQVGPLSGKQSVPRGRPSHLRWEAQPVPSAAAGAVVFESSSPEGCGFGMEPRTRRFDSTHCLSNGAALTGIFVGGRAETISQRAVGCICQIAHQHRRHHRPKRRSPGTDRKVLGTGRPHCLQHYGGSNNGYNICSNSHKTIGAGNRRQQANLLIATLDWQVASSRPRSASKTMRVARH